LLHLQSEEGARSVLSKQVNRHNRPQDEAERPSGQQQC
jgi:hypothetical protein